MTNTQTNTQLRQAKRWVAGFLMACAGLATQAQTWTLGDRTGATVQPLLGVNIGPVPQGDAGNVDVTTHYQQRGVNLVRTHDFYGPLDMATLYPDRSKDPLQSSSYNFTGALDSVYRNSSDSVFAAIVNGGFEPYFRIGDSYNNVAAPSPAELPNWTQAVVQVLRHYRQGQWNGFTSSFRFAEIWNEPNNLSSWPATRSASDFQLLFDQTAKALRAAFPTLKIGGPGWGVGACQSAGAQAQVRGLLDYVKANSTPMDFLSFHVYGTSPATFRQCAQFYRTELDNRGMNAVELHVTEWNTPDASAGTTQATLRYNAEGAADMTSAWIALQGAGVAQSTFYRGTDPSPTSNEFYGMLLGNGTPKKVGDAFGLWRDFTAYPQVLTSTGVTGSVTMMAAETSAGARAVLVANPGASAVSPSLAFADGRTLSDYRVAVSTVSDNAAGAPLTAPTANPISVPAKSVVLVRLTPRAAVFTASATASGTSGASTVTLDLTLAAADVGSVGNVYVAALVGTRWYGYSAGKWTAWTTGELPPTTRGNLPPSLRLTPISGMDLRGLSGTQIYVGYGTNTDDMVRNNRYRLAYRIP